jgi:hypothetical protein
MLPGIRIPVRWWLPEHPGKWPLAVPSDGEAAWEIMTAARTGRSASRQTIAVGGDRPLRRYKAIR